MLLGRNASACSLSVDEGTEKALRKNAGSPQRLQRSSRRLWQDVAADCGWQPASRTEDAGVEHCGRERPGTPKDVLAPKNGDKMGSLPATVWIFPRRNCSWFQLRSSGAVIACSAVALDRDAERKVDRAFWSEGLTGRAFRQHKKSWLSGRRWVRNPNSCRRKGGPKSASRSTSGRPAANHFW